MDQNILAILAIAILFLLVVILFIIIKNRTNSTQSDLLKLLEAMTKNTDQIVEASKNLHERMIRVETTVDKITKGVDDGFRDNRKEIATNLQTIQKTVDSRVKDLQTDNAKKLEEMRLTVDEKLQASVEKRFNESFKTISEQLTSVYKGLGEMKNLATGVGDLKKVMEGVKTRGIYGEVQLNSIISDILSPNQYQENISTKPGSADRIEFAVKMPGREEDHETYLPIDSKFPVENYSRLISAYDQGNKTDILTYQKALATDVKEQAKKISTKYIEPPFTTDFGMMFVPTESLYAEILRIPGLSDEIRQKYISASPHRPLSPLLYLDFSWASALWLLKNVVARSGKFLAPLKPSLINLATFLKPPRKNFKNLPTKLMPPPLPLVKLNVA